MSIYKESSVFKGRKLNIEIFGASHSEKIGVVASGFRGEKISPVKLVEFMDRRRPKNTSYSTKRLERDEIEFEYGFFNGKLDNSFKAIIRNCEQRSIDYKDFEKVPRPSHADYVAYTKYGNDYDYRGGGKFSGRMTAPMCIVGGICKQILEQKGIKVNAYLYSIGKIKGKSYRDMDENFVPDIEEPFFPLIDKKYKDKMTEEIGEALKDGDSVGGVIECVVSGVPAGTGEYMFDSLESTISTLAFAVPGVKGIEFGSGFDMSERHGSEVNDEFYYDENNMVKTKTNNNGGINGGIANGMNITFRVAMKPTPSITKEQNSVNLDTKENVKLDIRGRHDACIAVRAVAVIEAISAIAIYDNL